MQPFMITFCPPFGPESMGCSTKSYPFLVKFSNVGGLIFSEPGRMSGELMS